MAFTRREIGLGALAVAAVGATAIGFRLFGGRGTAVAGTFEVTHTPEEWRKLLSPSNMRCCASRTPSVPSPAP